MLQPNFQDLSGFDRLPQEEDAIEGQYRLEPEPELVKLLQDFGLFDGLGVQEIRSRVPHFTSLAHLLAIIHWVPRDWVRNVGARTVARLGAATYRLSCLSQNHDLVSFIQDTRDHVGRWDYYLTDQDLAAFQQEVENTVPRGRWNRELRTAIKNEIRMQVEKDIYYSSPTERFGWSVDISTRGFYISVDAPWNGENGEASGEMRLFDLDPKSQQWKIRGGPPQGEDVGRWFGNTVCLSKTMGILLQHHYGAICRGERSVATVECECLNISEAKRLGSKLAGICTVGHVSTHTHCPLPWPKMTPSS